MFSKLLTSNNSTKSQIHPSGMYVTLAMEPRFDVKVQCLNNKNDSIAKVTYNFWKHVLKYTMFSFQRCGLVLYFATHKGVCHCGLNLQ